MNKRRLVRLLAPPALACLALLGNAGLAEAAPLAASAVVRVSDHPFPAGCELAPQTGTNFPGAEVEPRVDLNSLNTSNVVGVFQQDRWSNGGAHGLVAATSHNGGATWTDSFAHFSRCTGGNTANGGDFERASDPWVTIAPSGRAFQIAISFNDSNPINGVLVSRSTTSGTSTGDAWENPITLIRDTDPTVFNDKESITADSNNASFVYAVWDRLVFPEAHASAAAAEHARAFRGPATFSRTTNGGASWEPARIIFDPGEQNQTISNQIVVLPASRSGTLINGFDLIFNHKNAQGERGFNIAVLRSTDRGATWSDAIVVDHQVVAPVSIPFTGQPVRTGDIIPDFAVDRATGAVYAVWQDGRFGAASILFSMSTDAGLHWTPAVKISKSPMGAAAFTPSVHVANDGTIGVTHYDFRNASPAAPGTTDYWLVHCHAATANCTSAANWSENHVAGPFDMRTAPVAQGFFVGDYQGLTHVGSHGFRPFFVMAQPQATLGKTDPFTTAVCPTTGTC